MKKLTKIFLMLALSVSAVSCSDFLDRESDSIYTNEEIFSDELMVKSALANLYGRVYYGPSIISPVDYGYIDEAVYGSNGGDPNFDVTYNRNVWRVYDYGLIRNINQFIQGVRATSVLDNDEKLRYEAEVRFLRAWVYFNMARGMGGVPIVGDKVYSYDANQDVAELQEPRSTEAGIYDYIISECDFAAKYLPSTSSSNVNAGRAISWVALALKARAAIYAGSLAKYNNLVTPQIKTANGEVGIPASEADRFYKIAYQAADIIMKSGQYALYNKDANKADNYYHALVKKAPDNPEIMWARDFYYPGHTQPWSADNGPTVLTKSTYGNFTTPLLNLVESYEYIDNRDGHLKYENGGKPIFYENPGDIFANKDPRMRGTILCNGDVFAGMEIIYQAGQYYYQGGRWKTRTGNSGSTDKMGNVITSVNGPEYTTTWGANKSGFNFRKFLSDDPGEYVRSRNSVIAFPYFRYAEVVLIASEAALELNNKAEALKDINMIRERAGLHDLTDMTLLDIEQERRVEFPLENHRWWDLKRWRRAHIVWDGVSENSMHYTLFPYRVVDPRRPKENGKWVYVRGESPIRKAARQFQLRDYYNEVDPGWMSNNPKLVKNPYQ